jgi:hypothetical protein
MTASSRNEKTAYEERHIELQAAELTSRMRRWDRSANGQKDSQ